MWTPYHLNFSVKYEPVMKIKSAFKTSFKMLPRRKNAPFSVSERDVWGSSSQLAAMWESEAKGHIANTSGFLSHVVSGVNNSTLSLKRKNICRR